jgi:D-beta-D-heptose 7-phosphate kinase/D-beta-D-heptose 1-phosphate adenosyltransferase
MKTISFARAQAIVGQFHNTKVLVVGDLILDEFIWGKVTRISPEAPIPVVWVKSENFIPGGACNVASNILSLGGMADVVGVIGGEGRGRMLVDLLKKKGVGTKGIWKDASRPTTLKTRVIAHSQQVVRIDRENQAPVAKAIQAKIMKFVRENIHRYDAILIEDYGKGVITPELVSTIVRYGKRYKKTISVDPKESHMAYYKGVTTLTPNHHEASHLVNVPIHDDASLKKAGGKLLNRLQCKNVLITLGENGMCLFQKSKKAVKIPTLAQDVFDVSGAGDTVIGTYTLALARGANPLEAAHVANCAAGIVVGKVGTATVTQKELLDRCRQVMKA